MTTQELCRVLIVDDEVLIRQGIKHYMNWEQEGFTIVGEASNGKEALEMIAKMKPHIVLTDIVMPVMDGNELAKAVKTTNPDIEVIVLSSFGDFDYVRSTFQSGVADYILKPKLETQELLLVLQKAASKVPSLRGLVTAPPPNLGIEPIIEKLIAGYEASCDEKELREFFPHNSFALIGIELKGALEAEEKQVVQLLENTLQTEAPSIVVRTVKSEADLLLAVLNFESSQLQARAAERVAAALANGMEEAGLARLYVVRSDIFQDFYQIGHVYRDELLRLRQYAFFLPDLRLIAQNELPKPQAMAEQFHLNRFTDDLKRGQFDAAFGELKHHTERLTTSYTTDVFEFKSFLSNLIFNIIVLLGNMDYDVKPLEQIKFSCFNAINEARNAQEAAGRLYAFIDEALTCIESQGSLQNAGSGNMKRLLDYIEAHYAEPLTLKDMAKHFHFNPSYLSSYFTAHNKEGFVEYLNKVRTEKAAELLRSNKASISEISGLVGYSDHSYFCKVFKKMTGLSPSQFRRQSTQ